MSELTAADMDGGWKQVIEDYLEEFFRYFFPLVHASIDFGRGYQYLDKELAKIMVGNELGDREVDKLLQVHWNDGGSEWVLIHVEVQATRNVDFAQRMCVYNCRIWERYNKSVVSLALLVDDDPRFRPNGFLPGEGWLSVGLYVPGRQASGPQETNRSWWWIRVRLHLASLIQLRKLQAGGDMERRYGFKLAIVRELYHRGYDRDDVLKLLRFMDYLLKLPPDLSIQFGCTVETIEEELQMPYVTSWEQHAQSGGDSGRCCRVVTAGPAGPFWRNTSHVARENRAVPGRGCASRSPRAGPDGRIARGTAIQNTRVTISPGRSRVDGEVRRWRRNLTQFLGYPFWQLWRSRPEMYNATRVAGS